MQVVTEEGKNIEKVTDLKGKRVSTGAPESRTQKMALRIIEAYGLDPNKDIVRSQLTLTESAGALRDKKIDTFFWLGSLPTSAILDLSTPPAMRMKLISNAEAIPKMREKYGPIYIKGVIPAKTYPGQDTDVPIAVVWNLLVCHEDMKENLAYDIVRTLFDHKPELVVSLSDAKYLSLETQETGGSPIPFHPGAIRYFSEKGFKIK
jgi:TRAP transporter TAXI family solute receptor